MPASSEDSISSQAMSLDPNDPAMAMFSSVFQKFQGDVVDQIMSDEAVSLASGHIDSESWSIHSRRTPSHRSCYFRLTAAQTKQKSSTRTKKMTTTKTVNGLWRTSND